jgi:hypothetical protein
MLTFKQFTEGKYLKYSNLLLKKGRLYAKNPNSPEIKKIDKEIQKELQKLGIKEDLDEGRMKELHMYIQQKKSAEWIAKKMNLDVKTVKALMSSKKY